MSEEEGTESIMSSKPSDEAEWERETEPQWSEMTYLRSHGWLVADLRSNPFTDF